MGFRGKEAWTSRFWWAREAGEDTQHGDSVGGWRCSWRSRLQGSRGRRQPGSCLHFLSWSGGWLTLLPPAPGPTGVNVTQGSETQVKTENINQPELITEHHPTHFSSLRLLDTSPAWELCSRLKTISIGKKTSCQTIRWLGKQSRSVPLTNGTFLWMLPQWDFVILFCSSW